MVPIFQFMANHRSKKFHVLFIVVDSSNTVPIIGLKTSKRLNLVRGVFKVNTSESEDDAELFVDYIPDDYLDCFGYLGTLNKTYHIELKDNIQPTVVPPRKVPFALRDKLKKELDRMEKMDVIEKVEKSTDWVNAAVVVEKPNGKLHVCLDPRPLNQAIKHKHHRLPTAEELISQMSGATTFSKLDAVMSTGKSRLTRKVLIC